MQRFEKNRCLGCVSISAFASLIGIPIGIMTSAIVLKICIITAGIKKYKSTIKRRNMIKLYCKQNLSWIA